MAAQKNFEVDQNTTFSFEVQYLDEDQNPIQLNSHTAKLQVRDTQGGKKLAFTLTETDGIVISPTLGKLQISISAEERQNISGQGEVSRAQGRTRKSNSFKRQKD